MDEGRVLGLRQQNSTKTDPQYPPVTTLSLACISIIQAECWLHFTRNAREAKKEQNSRRKGNPWVKSNGRIESTEGILTDCHHDPGLEV